MFGKKPAPVRHRVSNCIWLFDDKAGERVPVCESLEYEEVSNTWLRTTVGCANSSYKSSRTFQTFIGVARLCLRGEALESPRRVKTDVCSWTSNFQMSAFSVVYELKKTLPALQVIMVTVL